MTESERKYVISRLDWFYDLSTCIVRYFKQHSNVSFGIAKETYQIAKAQLSSFLRDYSAMIYLDGAMYNYYECIIREFDFIDNNLTTL